MVKNEIEQLLKPVIEDLGYELWGSEYLSQGKHSLLRIYIDKEQGINIEDCERVSKQVSAILDIENPITGNYSLEISSPGIARPLFNREQYQRYSGQTVQLKLYKPILGRRNLMGAITAIKEHSLLLKVGDEQLEVQFNQIAKANLTGV